MKNILSDLSVIFKNMNFISKAAMKYGTALILTMIILSLFFYIKSNYDSEPYFYIQLYTDLMLSVKECMGAVYILPLISEIILIASGRKEYT